MGVHIRVEGAARIRGVEAYRAGQVGTHGGEGCGARAMAAGIVLLAVLPGSPPL